MALPALLSIQFAEHSELFEQTAHYGWAAVLICADGIRHATVLSVTAARLLWAVTLVVGLMVLLPSQMSVVDEVSRCWTDVMWSASARVRNRMGPHQVKYIYYAILACCVLWCMVSLFLFGVHGTPKLMFLVVANLAIGLTSFHILWINCRLLSRATVATVLPPRRTHRLWRVLPGAGGAGFR